MKILPQQVELNETDIQKAISYYLTRLGYGTEDQFDRQPIHDQDFKVEIRISSDGFDVQALATNKE